MIVPTTSSPPRGPRLAGNSATYSTTNAVTGSSMQTSGAQARFAMSLRSTAMEIKGVIPIRSERVVRDASGPRPSRWRRVSRPALRGSHRVIRPDWYSSGVLPAGTVPDGFGYLQSVVSILSWVYHGFCLIKRRSVAAMDRFEKFSEPARRVLSLAQDE